MLKYITLCITAFFTTQAMAQVDPVFNASGHFGQTNITYDKNDDFLYGAASKFRISSTVDSANANLLFDVDYDNPAITVAAAGNSTITVDFKGKGGLSVADPQGYLIIDFFDSYNPDSLYTRLYDSTGSYTDYNFSDWENISTTSPFIRLRLRIADWVAPVAKIEIKAFAPSSTALKITELEYYLENRSKLEGGLVTKYGANTLYCPLKLADTSGLVKGSLLPNGNAFLAKLALGTSNINDDSSRLFVEGRIRGREVRLDLDTWPDYVFYKTYKLPTLQQVQTFIRQNGHLPGVPSAEEVAKKGLELGKGQATLLQKIEELTLYLLKQEKEMDHLRREINQLKAAAKK